MTTQPQLLTGARPSAQATSIFRRVLVGVDPSPESREAVRQGAVLVDPAGANLYITTSNKGGPYDGSSGDVWKYAIASGTWTQISPVKSSDSNDSWRPSRPPVRMKFMAASCR